MKAHTIDKIIIDGKEFLTRAWVMASPFEEQAARHRAYYGQFVTPGIEQIVKMQFKREWPTMVGAFLENGDKYFNTCTELRKWDALNDSIRRHAGRKVTLCAYADPTPGKVFWSLSECVCIGKEAARLMIEREQLAQSGSN